MREVKATAYPLILFTLVLFSSPHCCAQADHVLEQVSQSLVKIEAGSASASGFLWFDSAHAVTALHVVDGQKDIISHYVNAEGRIVASSQAIVEKVLKESDLVLLRLETPQNRPALAVNPEPPRVKQSLDAVGFPLNIPGYSNTEVKVRFGGRQLQSILPPKVLKRMGEYPSVTSEILNLEGNLVPGLSGAPLIDGEGKVVGIVDGGLESGAIGICWGIPAAHLQLLAASSVTRLPGAPRTAEMFAADLNADVDRTIDIGDIRLTKLRSRTFQELADTADDQLGLNQLAAMFSIFNPYSFRYDIYQDLTSGATVVVPEGGEISEQGNFAVVSTNDPRMKMKFRITRTENPFEQQQESEIFERQLTELNGRSQAMVDPAWSYLLPITRPGMMANRKGIYRNVFNGLMWQTDKYYFETLAASRTTLLAVAAVNNDNTPPTLQMEMLCGQGLQAPQCLNLTRSRQLWAQMVLGVQLASFPQLQM